MDGDITMLRGLGQSTEWLVDALDAWDKAPAAVKMAVATETSTEGKVELVNAVIRKYGGVAGPGPSTAAGVAGPGPSTAAGGAGLGQGSLAGHERVAARCTTASKYCGYVEVQGNRGAVTVVSPHEAVTYAHGDHAAWRLGDRHEVFLNDEKSDARKKVAMRVVHKRPSLDMVTLQVEDMGSEQLSYPPLDAGISPGASYIVVGCSATQQLVDPASVGHGSIASTSPDAKRHIRGDTPPSAGDSGGGCFSVETGKLIAVCVGREMVPNEGDPQGPRVHGQKAVLVPIMAVLEGLLPGAA